MYLFISCPSLKMAASVLKILYCSTSDISDTKDKHQSFKVASCFDLKDQIGIWNQYFLAHAPKFGDR